MTAPSKTLSRRLALLPLLGAILLSLAPLGTRQAAQAGEASAAADSTIAAATDTASAAADSLGETDTLAQALLLSEMEIKERLRAVADSLAAEGYETEEIEAFQQALRDSIETAQAEIVAEAGALGAPFGLTNTVDGSIKADVTKVNYKGGLSNVLQVPGGGSFNDNLSWSFDSYRRQQKTTENRMALGNYDSGLLLPFQLRLQASTNWMEDLTTNAAGTQNVNRRQTRRAGVSAGKTKWNHGPVLLDLQADWFFNDQKAVNQQQRNDSEEGELSGAVRSLITVADAVQLNTRLYRVKREGDNVLAEYSGSASTAGDTLGAGVFYKRQRLQGKFTINRTSFEKSYLDYRRNTNGLIDTMNLQPGIQKIVQELEEQNAVNLNWDNSLKHGRYEFVTKLEHTFSSQQYEYSLVGRRERMSDKVNLQLLVPVARDSFALSYKYEWTWDDQRFAGATAFRGRQFRKVRDLSLDWQRQLFRHTTLTGRYRAELTQDIAQNMFNENDRDRLTEEGRLRLEAFWRQRFRAVLLAEYQSIHDMSIRASRSANNNRKRTFEVSPGYRYFLGSNIELAQTYRMYIQYQDYDYADFETVNKDDTFNKRGSLASSVKLKPNERLEVTVKHDYNQRYNGTRTIRDAQGNTYYRRDQEQVINRIELGFSWTAISWSRNEYLRFQTATYRTRDAVEKFGATTSSLTERYSGELWLGALFNRKWGPKDNPLHCDAAVRRYLAYGPNVTETSKDYWKADVSLKWSF